VTRRPWLSIALSALAVSVLAACGGSGPSSKTGASTAARGRKTEETAARRSGSGSSSASRAPALATGTYRGPVPILMYHVISSPTPGTPYPELWTPRPAFAAQMQGLAQAGYHAVTLQQAWDAWHDGAGLPAKPVVVSFDDGYLSHLTRAAPVLYRLGWRGVLNLEVHNVMPGDLTRGQVKQLIGLGWEIDAHTMTHPDLTTVDAARLADEVGGSRRTLRQMFGVPVNFFAYPAGRYNAAAQQAVRDAGFDAAVTTQPGIATDGDDPTILPRVRVDGNTSPATLLSELSGASSLPTGSVGG